MKEPSEFEFRNRGLHENGSYETSLRRDESKLREDNLLRELGNIRIPVTPPGLTDQIMNLVDSDSFRKPIQLNERAYPVYSQENYVGEDIPEFSTTNELPIQGSNSSNDVNGPTANLDRINRGIAVSNGKIAIAWAFFVAGVVAGTVLTLALQKFGFGIPGVPQEWLGSIIQLIFALVLFSQMDVLTRYTQQVFQFRKQSRE